MHLASSLLGSNLSSDKVSLYWIGGAGFIIKYKYTLVAIDIYLSDFCKNGKDDFKRLVPPPFAPEDIRIDHLVCTHTHGDHFDEWSLNKLVNRETRLFGPDSVIRASIDLGINPNNVVALNWNETINYNGIEFKGIYCDHGETQPDAIGVLLKFNNITIYFTGDSCLRPYLYNMITLDQNPDILLVPINGKFGNPDAKRLHI